MLPQGSADGPRNPHLVRSMHIKQVASYSGDSLQRPLAAQYERPKTLAGSAGAVSYLKKVIRAWQRHDRGTFFVDGYFFPL
jgi:hypothetical protein